MSEIVEKLENNIEPTIDEIRDFISQAESKMLEVSQDSPFEIPVTNYFSKSVYAREIFIPKGTWIVGKIHKFENLNILSKGDISILSIDGMIRVKAPYTVVSSPGVKRLAYAHEDTIWTTIHGTEETDVDKIEEIFIAKTYDEVISHSEKNVIEGG